MHGWLESENTHCSSTGNAFFHIWVRTSKGGLPADRMLAVFSIAADLGRCCVGFQDHCDLWLNTDPVYGRVETNRPTEKHAKWASIIQWFPQSGFKASHTVEGIDLASVWPQLQHLIWFTTSRLTSQLLNWVPQMFSPQSSQVSLWTLPAAHISMAFTNSSAGNGLTLSPLDSSQIPSFFNLSTNHPNIFFFVFLCISTDYIFFPFGILSKPQMKLSRFISSLKLLAQAEK